VQWRFPELPGINPSGSGSIGAPAKSGSIRDNQRQKIMILHATLVAARNSQMQPLRFVTCMAKNLISSFALRIFSCSDLIRSINFRVLP